MPFRHEDGSDMTLKQVLDIAWCQFGPGAILEETAARLAWNGRWCAPEIHELLMKDAAQLASIADDMKTWEAAEQVEVG